MIARDIAQAVANWLATSVPAGVNVYEAGAESLINRPCVLVSVNDPVEHPVLLGNYRMQLELELQTIPEDTTRAVHRSIARELDRLLRETEELWGAIRPKVAAIHDARRIPGHHEEDPELRLWTCGARLQVARAGLQVSTETGIPDGALTYDNDTLTYGGNLLLY